MARAKAGSDRRGRTEALSRERIVKAAIALLDSDGEEGLTFRALSARLATGAGAIYWHVANKGELLAATTDHVVASVLDDAGTKAKPADAIRAVSLALFDLIDRHPWVGAQLSRAPWESAMLQIFERIGAQLRALHVADEALFFTATTLVNYVLGVAVQNAADARNPAHDGDRAAFLGNLAAKWSALAADKYPFVRMMAARLVGHDDREQFLAGIDLILAGITRSVRRPKSPRTAHAAGRRARA